MQDTVLILARKLIETEDIDEARDIASQLQHAIREHVEELATRHYRLKMSASTEGHPTNVVEMPGKQYSGTKR